MADSDKNILITPNRGSTTDLPKIEFTGADPNTITLSVLDDATLSFSGTSGQLFSISDSLTGTIFSVNDVSGIPSIEVDDDGTVRLAEFAGNLLVGTDVDVGDHKVQIKSDVYNHPLHITSAFGDKIKLTSTHASIQSNSIDFYANDKNMGSVRGVWSSNFKQVSLGVSFDTDANTQGRRLYIPMTGNPYFRYGGTSDYTVFHDAYHPNADKWTTARTISLSGDLNGSVSLDGSANVTLSAQVVNDSHNHYFITSNTPGNAPDNALQYWQASGQGTDYAPTTDWYNTIRGGHGDPNTYYSNTLAMKMTGSYVGTIHTQARSNGTLQGWNQHWHSNNDGPGSGLDADLLDGLDSTRYTNLTTKIASGDFNTIFNTDTAFTTQISQVENITSSVYTNKPTGVYSYGSVLNWRAENSTFQLYTSHTGDLVYRTGWNNDGYSGWRRVLNTGYYGSAWTSDNDGPGSGLDADLLDGLDSGSFLRSDADDTASGQYNFTKVTDHAIKVGTIRGTAVGSQTGQYIHLYERVHIGSPNGWGSNSAPSYGLSTHGGVEFCQGEGYARIGDTISQSHGGLQILRNGGTPSTSGYSVANGSSIEIYSNNEPVLGFHNSGNSACSLYESAGDLYLTRWNGTATGSRLWHSNNDGVGSGLDADLLDGQHGSHYTSTYTAAHVGLDTSGSTSYPRMFARNNPTGSGDWLRVSTTGGGLLPYSNGNSFVGTSSWRFSQGWFNSLNGGTAWTSVNDGPGSGLDADLLDGVHRTSFLRSDVADYINGNIYLRADITNETAHRDHGVYGFYDSTKINHIWSMGVNYRVPADGSSFGNLYGLAYKHTNNSTGGTMGGSHQMVWCQNGTPKAALGGNIWTAGNVTAYSDRRVKTNLEVIPNALEKVQQLNGYTFDRTDVTYDEEGEPLSPIRQTGVVAQEVLEVLPEAVTGSEGEHYSVAYGNMVGLLIEAIKEQQIQIEDLSSELKSLKENN